MELKLHKVGNSLATTWSMEVLIRLDVTEGDKLHVVETQHGVLVTAAFISIQSVAQFGGLGVEVREETFSRPPSSPWLQLIALVLSKLTHFMMATSARRISSPSSFLN